MTQPAKRTPADVLREARRTDSERKRNNVFRTVDRMKREGVDITFAAVARTAQVSNWLVYADGVREYIEAARKAQTTAPARAQQRGRTATEASLRSDLELARQDNRALRGEVARLKQVLRERLGEQLDATSSETLRQRVDHLTEANNRYREENLQLRAELAQSHDQLRAAEDDLAAARDSVRRMIKEHSQHLQSEAEWRSEVNPAARVGLNVTGRNGSTTIP
jgi:methyl-accepting chemotaxis protein